VRRLATALLQRLSGHPISVELADKENRTQDAVGHISVAEKDSRYEYFLRIYHAGRHEGLQSYTPRCIVFCSESPHLLTSAHP
jgi:hypothetical protein